MLTLFSVFKEISLELEGLREQLTETTEKLDLVLKNQKKMFMGKSTVRSFAAIEKYFPLKSEVEITALENKLKENKSAIVQQLVCQNYVQEYMYVFRMC